MDSRGGTPSPSMFNSTMDSIGTTRSMFDTHGDGSLRCMVSPKTGDGTASMQKFIQEHMMSILQPVGEHVGQLQEELDQLRKELALRDAKLDRHQARLDSHDDAHLSLQSSVEEDKSDIARLRAELANLAELRAADSRTFSGGLAEAVGRLDALTSNAQSMGTTLKDCQASLQELQRPLPEAAKAMDRALLADLRASHASLCERHGNLARSHQLIIGNLESYKASQDLLDVPISELQRQRLEDRQNIDANCQGTENLGRSINALHEVVGRQAEFSKSIDSEIDNLRATVGVVKEDISALKGTSNERNLSTTEAHIAVLSVPDRLSRLEDTLTAEMKHNLPAVVADIAQRLGKSTSDISMHSEDIRSIGALQKRHSSQLQNMDQRIREGDATDLKFQQWAEGVSSQLSGLSHNQQATAANIDLHRLEITRAQEYQQQSKKSFGEVSTYLKSLSGEVGSANADLASVKARIDLAHEYLDGMSKGLQGTHQHVLVGSGGMLPPKGGQSRTLPGLSSRGPLAQGNKTT